MLRTTLDPRTIIGVRKDGRPIYLMQGGSSAEGGGAGAGGDGGQGGNNAGADQGGQNTGQQGAQQQSTTPFDHITDPAELRQLAARLQNEAASNGGKAREQARAAAAADAEKALTQKLAVALGLAPDENADPKELQAKVEQLTAANTERDRELAIYREALAPGMGVDVGRLLDSRSFMRSVSDIDPNSDTAAADIKAKITAAVTSDQSLKARAGGAAGGSVEHAGGAGDRNHPDLSKLHGTALLAGAYADNASK